MQGLAVLPLVVSLMTVGVSLCFLLIVIYALRVSFAIMGEYIEDNLLLYARAFMMAVFLNWAVLSLITLRGVILLEGGLNIALRFALAIALIAILALGLMLAFELLDEAMKRLRHVQLFTTVRNMDPSNPFDPMKG